MRENNLENEFKRYLEEYENEKGNTLDTKTRSIYYKNLAEFSVYEITNLKKYDIEIIKIKNSEKYKKINDNTKKNYNAAFGYYRKFLQKISNLDEEKYETASIEENIEYEKIDKSHQRIFFGAPGTGKSFQLNEEAEENFPARYERVTFHPNYMYGQFIGTFKPFPKIIENSNGNRQETITYNYIPGILLKILVKAIKTNEPQLLIIEEINRANTAAVFGDFFQLLDRNSNGESEYQISTSEDIKLYFKKEFLNENGEIIKEYKQRVVDYLGGKEFSFIKLPSNLYIWATMNSADQGVMPLDTAFKRRWDFEYFGIGLNENQKEEFKHYVFNKSKEQDEEDFVINWNDYREKINELLSKCGVPEDKMLGPYFISKSMLEIVKFDIDKKDNKEERKKLTEHIKNKVLMYLYEDAGKAYRNKLFHKDYKDTFSKLCKGFDENANKIFQEEIEIKETPYEKHINIIKNKNEEEEIRVEENTIIEVTDTLESENSES